MPLKDPELRRAYKKEWRDKNRHKVREQNRVALRKYRYGTPEKHAAYNARKREWYTGTKEERLSYKKEWRKENWESEVSYRLKAKYDLSYEQFMALRKAQNDQCPVCVRKFSAKVIPNVDHCHTTGIVRGLLCTRCNYAEGQLKTPDNARRLYEYMLKNQLFYQGKN